MLASCYSKHRKALCSVLIFLNDPSSFKKGRNKALDHSLKLENIHLNLEAFSSVFFFAFHKKSTSLRKANEKDSASMSYK